MSDLPTLTGARRTVARFDADEPKPRRSIGRRIGIVAFSIVAALTVVALVAAGFVVWTIQRSGDIAVMRAMGATKGFLLRDSLGQAVVILALSIGVGVAIALALGAGLEASPMPYATELAPVAGGAASTSASCSSPATCPPR